MPIYAYGCSNCGLHKDVMQKMSDLPLTTCPDCGKETFSKQLTAASFQLKGSGYYVTDFKGGSRKPEAVKPEAVKPEAGRETVAMPASTTSAPVTSSTT